MPSRDDEQALAGLRVVDFSRVLAGPFATMYLGDFGADVIKIESAEGDETRHWKPPVDGSGESTYFSSVNRNKRAVCLDLKDPDGLAAALSLIDGADVLVENFRPGVMDRLGLGYDALRERNPALVYASISGFGSAGGTDLPGYDLIVQALGGLMSITGEADGPAMKVGVALVDILTGLHTLTGVLAALRARDRSGRGQHVEVSLLGSLLAGLSNQAAATLATGVAPERMGNAHPSIAPYEVFATGDGEIAIAAGNQRQFHALSDVLGGVLAFDPRFLTNEGRVKHRAHLRDAMEVRLAGASAAEWEAILRAANVPAGRVNSIGDAIALADSLGLTPVAAIAEDGVVRRSIANPITLSETPATYRIAPPRQHPEAATVHWNDERKTP